MKEASKGKEDEGRNEHTKTSSQRERSGFALKRTRVGVSAHRSCLSEKPYGVRVENKGGCTIADIKWIKLSTDIFDNRKIRQLQNLPQGDTLLVIWLKLLVLAGQINDGGLVYITPDIGYSTQSLAAEMQRPETMVQLAMDCFLRFGMVEVDERGIIFLPNWEAYQNVDGMERIREQNRVRQKRRYDKKKALKEAHVSSHVSITESHATEEEKEKEREEEKEIHSINHSGEENEGLSNEMTYLGGALGQGVVLLSDAQMEDLLQKMSVAEFDKYVSIVAKQELAGKHYKKKTHYQAILDMAKQDRRIAR